jgi:hypothetical protein
LDWDRLVEIPGYEDLLEPLAESPKSTARCDRCGVVVSTGRTDVDGLARLRGRLGGEAALTQTGGMEAGLVVPLSGGTHLLVTDIECDGVFAVCEWTGDEFVKVAGERLTENEAFALIRKEQKV